MEMILKNNAAKESSIEMIREEDRVLNAEVELGEHEQALAFVESAKMEVMVGRAEASRRGVKLKLRMVEAAEKKFDKFSRWIDEVGEENPEMGAKLYLQMLESIVPKLERETGEDSEVKNQTLNVFSAETGEKILKALFSKGVPGGSG